MNQAKHYATITAAYWAFTLTDGALRMLVLLFLQQQGFSPLEIASLFLSYEFFGVVTNFSGGWVAARIGLRATLVAGLMLQVAALGILAWHSATLGLGVLLLAQGLGGVAKDLTKMSAKSYLKFLVAPQDGRGLMKWVALLTGSKNTLKGCGFFLGGALLQWLGFRAACLWMGAALLAVLLIAPAMLPKQMGKSAGLVKLSSMFTRDGRINWLSTARLFLFGARDAWFVLALPIYLASEMHWSHGRVGGFLALWVIAYGIVQAAAPLFVSGLQRVHPPRAKQLGLWTFGVLLALGGSALSLAGSDAPRDGLFAGLFVFGACFAACSAIHSFLILVYAESTHVAQRVGFYYMANAAGRLLGTLISGAVYQAYGQGIRGLEACLWAATGLALLSALGCWPLSRVEAAKARTSG